MNNFTSNTIMSGMPGIINGDKVIGFTTTDRIKEFGWMDRASLASWYQEDPVKNHIGMVELFTNFAQVAVPTMKNLFDNKAIIEVNGMDGTFTYDVPVYKPTGTFTMEDQSTESDFPGIDESVFLISLSKPYQPGDVLTYDKQYGEQLVVSEDAEVIDEGDYFTHTVHLNSNNKAAYFPKDKLKAGIQYWKIGHVLGEFSTQFSNIESPSNMGTFTCEFVLGNHRGVETFYTMYADKKSPARVTTRSMDMWQKFVDEQSIIRDDMGRPANMMFVGRMNPGTGKLSSASVRIGATLEYLVLLENIKMEANQLLFQKGGMIKGNNGTKRLNEGVWHQMRRGRKITYSRPGGITRDLIRQAAAYVFQSRPDLPIPQRKLHFKAGMGAWQNLHAIFADEFRAQYAALGYLLGTERTIPNPVSGGLDGLILNPVVIKGVYLPDIGLVTVEHDPSLDFQVGSDRIARGLYGQGHSKDSYSMVIWDASSAEYSNARTNLPSGTTLVDGGNKGANVFYVKPEGDTMWWGYEQGRWAPNKASDIMSSSKTMSREFWVHSTSAAWVKDISKFLIIELKR